MNYNLYNKLDHSHLSRVIFYGNDCIVYIVNQSTKPCNIHIISLDFLNNNDNNNGV